MSATARTTWGAHWGALLAGTALASALVVALPAVAEEQTTVEAVVVTARERAENLHSVPAQVSAFTAQQINDRGIQSPAGFLDAVPNVTFIPTQNAGTSFIVIRGISQARNSEPSAAIVVDGVPMTQPTQFNQALVDIQQIEVIKGPQGALYGRNAIGGAILITTKPPSDHFEGSVTAGYDSGPGGKIQGVVSGPILPDFKARLAVSYVNTDGYLRNADTVDRSARRNADPVEDFNARASFVYQPTSNFTADLRLSTDLLNTRGLYYIIPPFGSPNFNNPNFVNQPINLNNSGKDDRKIYDGALKLTYQAPYGTFTSITGYNSAWEILTGDGYPFNPFGKSMIDFDFDQSQFLTVQTFSQELRFTSPAEKRFRWIAGGEIFSTRRFISTGNMFDTNDNGVAPIYRTPNPPLFEPQGQISYLADSQRQFAWALYFDTSTSITDRIELSLNFRYDSDRRRDTTDTPQFFLDSAGIPAMTGDTRSHTWSAFQPQAILRYTASDNINLYASYSRGFRSGGFNQTGVATAAANAGFDNVGDMFNAETADAFEVGFKSRWRDGRLTLNGSAFLTKDHNDYYFVFLASNSTQNLGNIPAVRFEGFDLDGAAHITPDITLDASFGYTDSRITAFPGASGPLVIGARAPLVSEYTLDAGIQYRHPITDNVSLMVRFDDSLIGPTTFVIPVPAAGEPVPIARDPVNLLNVRAGFQGKGWQVMFWSKNLTNKLYNVEYSTGGFLFKADPRSWGVDITKSF